jgi:translation initiation factor 1
MENDWKKRLGVVYSTNPDFQYDNGQEEAPEFLSPEEQLLYVSLDKKNRKGKAVTLIEGFRGSDEELKSLGKDLRKKCGVGGTARDGEILLQGDLRDRVSGLLKESGFKVKRKGG